jgi:hypothetical protein
LDNVVESAKLRSLLGEGGKNRQEDERKDYKETAALIHGWEGM